MSRFKVAMCTFIIFRQEHTDIRTYGHEVRVERISLGMTADGSSGEFCISHHQVLGNNTGSAIRLFFSRQDQFWVIIHGQGGEGEV